MISTSFEVIKKYTELINIFILVRMNVLPKQNSLTYSYFKVSKWLLVAFILFIIESFLYYEQLERVLLQENYVLQVFWGGCFIFSFVHIFLVIMDSWSRFQNYKRLKDQLYTYSFQPKIANNYLVSKCQRRALKIACNELGLSHEYHRFLELRGVKWHHFIPYFMVQDPFFLLKKHFWNRTFLEKYYEPKYDFRKLTHEKESEFRPLSS